MTMDKLKFSDSRDQAKLSNIEAWIGIDSMGCSVNTFDAETMSDMGQPFIPESITCDNCRQAEPDSLDHRCRADETSCIDGADCPDYVDKCACAICAESENTDVS
jgi:hypothetical protein